MTRLTSWLQKRPSRPVIISIAVVFVGAVLVQLSVNSFTVYAIKAFPYRLATAASLQGNEIAEAFSIHESCVRAQS